MMFADPNARLCRIKDFRPRLSTRLGPLGWIVVLVVAAISAPTSAAIVPRWRQNPITPAAIAYDPRLADAISFSLVVDLSDTSLFHLAGFRLDQTDLPGMEVYQVDAVVGLGNTRPPPPLILLQPSIEFDTYVTLPNSYNPEFGGAYLGPIVAISSRMLFDVQWGSRLGTGPAATNGLEVARLTLRGVRPDTTGIAVRGEVRSIDAPGTAITLPRLPVVIPEPASAAGLGVGLWLLRRCRSRVGSAVRCGPLLLRGLSAVR